MALRRASAVCAHVRGAPSARWVQLRPLCAAQEPPPTRFGPVKNGVAEITLCRPKKLNSLSWQMITELTDTYHRLGAEGVRCVVLRGEGRALCAGGDVAEIREGVLNGSSLPKEFFYHEYQLDYCIASLYERERIVQVAPAQRVFCLQVVLCFRCGARDDTLARSPPTLGMRSVVERSSKQHCVKLRWPMRCCRSCTKPHVGVTVGRRFCLRTGFGVNNESLRTLVFKVP